LQGANIAFRNHRIRILQWGNCREMKGQIAHCAENLRKFNEEETPASDFINQVPGLSWHKEGLHQ
jgi:hypothetical protein